MRRRHGQRRSARRNQGDTSAKGRDYARKRTELGADHPATKDAWKARLDELLTEEGDDPARGLWWLSFTDPSIAPAEPPRPGGPSWLGACLVLADGPTGAVRQSHVLGINPGGQVKIAGPIPLEPCPPAWRLEWCNRLLALADIEAMPGPDGEPGGIAAWG